MFFVCLLPLVCASQVTERVGGGGQVQIFSLGMVVNVIVGTHDMELHGFWKAVGKGGGYFGQKTLSWGTPGGQSG